MEDNTWYVYRHIRNDKNLPFYVGIGKTKNFKRAYEKYKCDRNIMWFRITDKTEYEVEILFENMTKEEASIKEKEFIKLYGRKDLGTGTLCNMTDGGDGVFNRKMSEETKEKIRQSKLGVKNPMYGKKHSKETTEKRIKALTGQKRSEEYKKLRSLHCKDNKEVEVYCVKTNDFIGIYRSLAEACRQLPNKPLPGKASLVATGKRTHTKGYVFKYTK